MRIWDTDCGEVGGQEVVLAETEKDVGFAHAGVPDYQELREIVVSLVFSG